MIDRVYQQVQSTKNYCIDDLLSILNIEVFHDERMNNKKNDAFLDASDERNILFIKDNLNEDYERFVILHEIGHLLLHYDGTRTFSFYLSRYKWRVESEANMFAFLYLLKDEDLEDQNILNIAIHKGIPEQIAIKAYESLSLVQLQNQL